MSAIALNLPEFGDADWDDLLDLVQEGQIVPVIGPGLFTTPDGSNYVAQLAVRLAQYLKLPSASLPYGRELHTVASWYFAKGGQPDRLYAALNRLAVDSGPIPESLLDLSKISALRLFLTTSFDPFLARALKEARSATPIVKTYRLERWEDVTTAELESARLIVYHLFGKLTAVPNEFAVTEEDTLEFTHALQSESRRPPVLFDELGQRALLILGCRFPNWLARFFLRIASKERLSSPYNRPCFITAQDLDADADQTAFLQQFRRAARIHSDIGPVEFVSELAARWNARNPASSPAPQSGAPGREPGQTDVFLSYASEDREAVKQIWRALDGAGIPAFFDRVSLEEGEEYRGVF